MYGGICQRGEMSGSRPVSRMFVWLAQGVVIKRAQCWPPHDDSCYSLSRSSVKSTPLARQSGFPTEATRTAAGLRLHVVVRKLLSVVQLKVPKENNNNNILAPPLPRLVLKSSSLSACISTMSNRLFTVITAHTVKVVLFSVVYVRWCVCVCQRDNS